MMKLISIVAILFATSNVAYSIVTHQTTCENNEPCVECHSAIDKSNNGYNEAKISYQPKLMHKLNNYRTELATNQNISNMKYTILMGGYDTLMKNLTLDIGEGNITCSDRLTGDGTHFSIADQTLIDGGQKPNEGELNKVLDTIFTNLIEKNPGIVNRFDTSRFGCFFGVKTTTDNKPDGYLLRCLFFADIAFNSAPKKGLACKNCALDDQCSVAYKGLCVNKYFSEPIFSGATKRAEFYVINSTVLLLLVAIYKFEF